MKKLYLLFITSLFIISCDSESEPFEPEEKNEGTYSLIFEGLISQSCGENGDTIPYEVTVIVLQNGEEIREEKFSGFSEEEISLEQTVEDDNFELIVYFSNFNPEDPEEEFGNLLTDVKLKLVNNEDEEIFSEDLPRLLICTDTLDKLSARYDKDSNNIETEVSLWSCHLDFLPCEQR